MQPSFVSQIVGKNSLHHFLEGAKFRSIQSILFTVFPIQSSAYQTNCFFLAEMML